MGAHTVSEHLAWMFHPVGQLKENCHAASCKSQQNQAKQQNKSALQGWNVSYSALKPMCVLLFSSSVVFSFVGLLGSHGVLRDRGQRRASHAGRLHDLDVPTGQTRHQLLARRTASEEEIVGHSGQYSTHNRPEPIDLKAGGRAELQPLRGTMSRFK